MRHARLPLITLALLFSALNPAQANRFIASTNGQEVTDTQTKLTWRRCPESMAFSSGACSGKLRAFTFADAQLWTAEQARNTEVAWEMPDDKTLETIATATEPASDGFPAFPSTRVEKFWSASFYGTPYEWFSGVYAATLEGVFTYGRHSLRLVRKTP